MVAGMPPELTEHPFLGVRNAGKWVNLQQYELFIRNSIGQSVSKPRSVTAVTRGNAGAENASDSLHFW
jgi:hypothetical protein